MNSYLDWSNKGNPAVWRYLLGSLILTILLFWLSGQESVIANIISKYYRNPIGTSLFGTGIAFAIGIVAILLVVNFWHKRPFWSVAMPSLGFWKWDFWISFIFGSLIYILTAILFVLIGLIQLESNSEFTLLSYLPIVVIAFVSIFIQSSSEELLFRGYWTQFVRRLTANKIVFLGIPALIFAAPHILNISEYYEGGLLLIVPFILPALAMGWAAFRSGTLWMSTGLHLSYNFSEVVTLGIKGANLPSAAPFIINFPTIGPLVLFSILHFVLWIFLIEYLLKVRNNLHHN